jgi:response regulator NasT
VRILIIDPDAVRGELVAEGLGGLPPGDVRRVTSLDQAVLQDFAPDIIVIACESPDRDTLESLQTANEANPRPVVMFVERSAPGVAEAAVEAGVAAYVVDGLAPHRVRPILDVAMTRFSLMQKLRTDLNKAQADLTARKAIERAKGILMKARKLEEAEAYRVIRSMAMDSGRTMAAVAQDIVAAAALLGGEA